MAGREVEMTEEQKSKDEAQKGKAEEKLKESLLNDLDLSADVDANVARGNQGDEVATEEKEEEKVEGEDASAEVEEEEVKTEETDEEAESEESEEAESEDDELVPKSKVQKRISSLVAENKALAARLAEKERVEAATQDDDTRKLNAMDEAGLKATKKAVTIAIAKAVNAGDDEKLDKLSELADKVDTAMSTLSTRFTQTQVDEYNKVAEQIVALGEMDITDKTAGEIKAIAKQIYDSEPDLQKNVKGQAIALKFAYQHYKVLQTKSAGKEKVDGLKRDINTLKRKTALDTGGVKAKVSQDAEVKKLRANAKGGTDADKRNLIKNDPAFGIDSLIPPEYKE